MDDHNSSIPTRPAHELEVDVKSEDLVSLEIPNLRQEVIDVAVKAISELNIEKEMAQRIKKKLDDLDKSKEGVTTSWQVVVGRNFGSFVTHEKNRFIYFYVGQFAVLAFKA